MVVAFSRYRLAFLQVLGIGFLAFHLPCAAAAGKKAPPQRAGQIQASFIYNFTKLTTWPTNAFKCPSDPIRIAVLGAGADDLVQYLEAEVQDRTIDGRRLVVSKIRPAGLQRHYHVLVVGRVSRNRMIRIADAVADRPVLTVGRTKQFADHGGIIRLVGTNQEVPRFEINREASRRANLVFSSRLLVLARRTSGEEKP